MTPTGLRRVHLLRPFGPVVQDAAETELMFQPLEMLKQSLQIIVPFHGRMSALELFLDRIRSKKGGFPIRLNFILFEQDSGEDGKDVFALQTQIFHMCKQRALVCKYGNAVATKLVIVNIGLELPTRNSRVVVLLTWPFGTLNTKSSRKIQFCSFATSTWTYVDACLCVNAKSDCADRRGNQVQSSFLQRCLRNSVASKQAYFPIVWSYYKNTPKVVMNGNGEWRHYGLGMACLHYSVRSLHFCPWRLIYQQDYKDIGGFDTSIQGWCVFGID